MKYQHFTDLKLGLFGQSTGANFTKGLKSRFRFIFNTLVLKSVALDLANFTKQVSP